MANESVIATGPTDAPAQRVANSELPYKSQPALYDLMPVTIAGSTSIGSGSEQSGQISPRF